MSSEGSGGNDPSVIVVTGPITLAPGKWLDFTTSNMPISVADAENDPIVTYRFIDNSAGAGSSYLQLNNINVAQGGTVEVAANQLSNLWIKGATANETDTLTVQVFDRYNWSDAADISVVTHGTNHAPVVSAATTSFGLGQTVAASSIFSVSDADGDSITQYQITDVTAGSAHLLLNGVVQAENTPITVTAAELSQLQIQTSSITHDVDVFQVSAYDGFAWSAPTSISVASGNTPSVETVTGALQFTPNQWMQFSVSNLPLSVTDADGDSIVTYRFTDVGATATSEHLWFSGLPGGTVSQGGSVDVAAGQLGGLWIQGGTTSGIDTLQVQVYDGFAWSAPVDIPVITNSAFNALTGNIVAGAIAGATNVLTGTAGYDTFVFAPNFGNDTINNYTPGQDAIAIDHSIFGTVTALLLATATDLSGNAVIHVDANDSITIHGVSAATLALRLTDFHIV